MRNELRNLYSELEYIQYEADRTMKYIASSMYSKFKGEIIEYTELGKFDDWIESDLAKLPSLENKFWKIVDDIHVKVKDSPEKIPEGCYCYSGSGGCPYLTYNPFAGNQSSGVCLFLNISDCKDLTDLWDQLKYCGIKDI
jgi:hypothetical protein